MENIKIFLSHRIDLEAEKVNMPFAYHIECGSFFKKTTDLLRDDVGDNISFKRDSYCELTVQYWMWKNVNAEYYGLCHYRRFFSFSDNALNLSRGKTESNNGCIVEDYITDEILNRYEINKNKMKKIILENDVVVCSDIDLGNSNNYDAMLRSPEYHNIEDMQEAMNIIKEKYPKMFNIAEKYMKGHRCRLYNCFIMKKNIFLDYSKWLFDILFELEKRVDISYYGIQKYRTFGTIGERLFGIYIMYLKENKFKVSERPLIFITYPKRQRKLIPFFNKNQITIVSNFNNEYVPVYTSFLISSLEKLSKDNKYEYIILSQDISNTNKLILEKLVEEYNMYLNIKITFYDPFIYLDRIKLFVDNPVYSKDLYVRIIIPYILSEYDKVIVIDCDTICNVDLSELYSIDLKNCILGAVKDVVLLGWLNDKLKDSLQYYKTILKNPYNYCNTGILLFNCSKARDKYTLEYILNCIEKSNYRIYEQDMINVLYQQDIYFLDEGWNVYTYSNAFIEQSIKLAPLKNYLAYINARKNPKIIHFAGHPKPWWVDCDFDIEFWKYARKSPYYEHLLHIKNWHLVNHMLLNNFKLSVKYRKKIVKFFFPIGSRRRIVYEIYKKLFK